MSGTRFIASLQSVKGPENGGIVMEPVNAGSPAGAINRAPIVGVAQGVWKAFGETQALRDVSMDVEAGECHGLVGRNGAGKSTLVAIFTGLIRTDRGVVRLGAEAAPALADRATWQRLVACVYQKPMVVPSLTVAEIKQDRLVEAMVGVAPQRATEIEAPMRVIASARPRLEISHLRIPATLGPVQDVSFSVSPGECVGLVGLQGSGSATVADAVVGLVKPASGEIRLDGEPIHVGRVDATLRQGVTYVPEDRHARGFVPYLGVGENLTLSILDRLSSWGIVSRSGRDRVAADLVEQLGIVTSGLDQRVGQLSGGNQQKVVAGRALARQPAVLVAVTPTVGVDVAAKESLLNVIGTARDGGTAVLLVSDDLEDLRICTRLLVMVKGRLVKEYRQPPWDRHELIAAVEGLEPASARGESE